MTRYKDNRFCEYVWCEDNIWTLDGETLVECTPENDLEPVYHTYRKNLTEAPVNFGCSYQENIMIVFDLMILTVIVTYVSVMIAMYAWDLEE